MPLNRYRLKMDKIWLKVKHEAKASERISTLPKEVTEEISILKQKLMESNLKALKDKIQRERQEWNALLAEKESQIKILRGDLEAREKGLFEYKKELELQQKKQIEQIKTEYLNLSLRSRENIVKKNLFDKELNIYQNAAETLKDKIFAERDNLKNLKEQWNQREKHFGELLASKEEELAQLREELVEKENRYYHQQAQTEGELNLLRNELARLRNLLNLEQSSAENTVEQAKENVLAMQSQLEKIQEQMSLAEHIKGSDKDTLAAYIEEIKNLRSERGKIQESFDQERVRWKELWEKERSSWLKKKQELQDAEDKLRYERERFIKLAWDGKVPVPHYDSSRKEGVAELSKPPIPEFINALDKSAAKRGWLVFKDVLSDAVTSIWLYAGVLALAAAVFAGYNLYLALQPAGNVFYPSLNPKAVYGFKNDLYLYMDSSKKINVYQKNILEIAKKEISIPEGVRDFVVEERFLWTLADDGKRISLRFLSEPDTIQGSYFTDEEAHYLAWDGKDIWTLNTATQRLNMHSIARKLRVVKRFQLSGINAGGMSFYKNNIWILDKNTKSIAVFSIGKTLRRVKRVMLPKFAGKLVVPDDFAVSAGKIWMINSEASFLYFINNNRLAWENFWN